MDNPPDPTRWLLADIAAALGVEGETVHKLRRISLAEGGAGPGGLPPRQVDDETAYDLPRRRRGQPWWTPEAARWWGVATGRLNPHTGQPQRMVQANVPHPHRPTVRRPRPAMFRRLVDDDTKWYLSDVARESGYPLATVKRTFRHTSLAEGGAGPHGMPPPDDFDPPVNQRPTPWWRAGTVRRWLIATGRMSPYTGAPQRLRTT